MENENKLESMEPVQADNSALQGPISLPETGEPVIEIASPSAEPTPTIEVQPIENPVVEPPVVEQTPTGETPTVTVDAAVPEQQPVMETPAIEPSVPDTQSDTMQEPAVESLETLAPPIDASSDNFQAQSVPTEPIQEPSSAATPSLDPSLNVQTIAPALDEIAAANAPKKKSKKGLVFILLLIVALVAAGVVYKFVLLKPDKAYAQVFNLYKEKVGKALDLTISPIESSILETGNITIETNYDDLKDLNDLIIGYKFGIDYNHKKIEFAADINEKSKEVLKAVVYLVNNKIYLSSEQIYSKMLQIGNFTGIIDTNEIFDNVKAADIAYAVKSIGNHFISSLDNADYSSKDTKINVGGKSVQVTDNIMTINANNFDKIMKSFYSKIKNDIKLIEIISNLTGTDVEQINTYIDSYVAEEYDNSGVNSVGELNVHIYTKLFTNKLVGIKADTNYKGNKQEIINIVFDKKNIEIIMDNYKIIAKSDDGKNYDVTVYEEDKETFNCKITINGDYDYSFETENDDYAVKITYKKVDSDYIMTASIKIIEETEYVKLDINSKTQYNIELDDVTISSAVDVNNLTSKDQTKVVNNIEKIISNSKAIKSLLIMLGYDDLIESTTESNSSKSLTEMCKDKDTVCSKCSGSICECVYHDGLIDEKSIDCPKSY